jgi:RNA polymerase sigma-70 factor (ECF subfamily)
MQRLHMGTDSNIDDLLIERFQAGEHAVFNLLAAKYQGKLLRVVSRLVCNRADAEEVVQEALVRAYRALPRFRREAAFYTWLFRIAINVARNFKKKEHLMADVSVKLYLENAEQQEYGLEMIDDHSPAESMENKQTIAALNRALDRLPLKLSGPLLLREFEGMHYAEIAQLMHCPIGTVRSRIARARQRIADRMLPITAAAQVKPRWAER